MLATFPLWIAFVISISLPHAHSDPLTQPQRCLHQYLKNPGRLLSNNSCSQNSVPGARALGGLYNRACDENGFLRKSFAIELKNLLAPLIKRSLETLIPHALDPLSKHPFDGAYDLHSSIHGHWAIMSMGRITEDRKLTKYIRRRFKNLDSTRKWLGRFFRLTESDRTIIGSFYPVNYTLSWMGMLIKELRELRPKYESLVKYTSWLQGNVLRFWAESTPSLKTNSASHYSEVFNKFIYNLSQIGPQLNLTGAKEPKRLGPNLPDDAFINPWDFLQKATSRAHLIQLLPVPNSLTSKTCHRAGVVITQAWVKLATVQPSSERLKTCLRIETVIRKLLASKVWTEVGFDHHFETVDHWLPQFIWMVVYLNSQHLM